jgi:hypothetical protein
MLTRINAKEHTITLSDVKSFGTEHRTHAKIQAPPSEQLYEFIIFRGADIKDIKVTKSARKLQDPAILEIGKIIPQKQAEASSEVFEKLVDSTTDYRPKFRQETQHQAEHENGGAKPVSKVFVQ